MSTTRGGEVVSPQIVKIGQIEGLAVSNFKLKGIPFNLKNDGEVAVFLDVNLWGMAEGEFVNTRFETGWNPEIIREIKQTTLQNLNLKYGF